MNSWKTTIGGYLSGGGILFAEFFPLWSKWGHFASALGMMILGQAARDNGVTSEQVANSQGSVVRGGKIVPVLAVCASLVLSGCSTPYQAVGVVTVTADHALDGWADYYVWQKKQPGYDAAKLEKQHSEVVAADLKYKAAMDTVYFARKAVNASQPGQTNSVPIEAVLLASKDASASLVNLILSFLPPERAATLKASP